MNTTLTTLSSAKTLRLINREIERDPRLKSENTRRGYRHDLTQFEEWRAGRPMTKLLVEEYAAQLQQEKKSPNTINRILASVRWWARKVSDLAFEDRGLSREAREEIATQAARVVGVSDVTGTREQRGRHISSGELSALMQACTADDSPAGTRDAAIVGLAWATGARRSELAGLTLADIKWTSETEADVTVQGKGDKVRVVYVYNGAAAALRDWLAIRGAKSGPLFFAVNKGGKVQAGHGVSDEALAQMLGKRAEQAELSDPITWHDFRRSFAGNLLDNGSDLVTVQKLMGHSSPTTTSNYDRRGEDVKRRASKALHVPYKTRRK